LKLQKRDTLDNLISLPAHAFTPRSNHTQHPSFLTESDEWSMYPILINISEFPFPFLSFSIFLALCIAIVVDFILVLVLVLALAGNMVLVPL
jgi:hypothetical protein